MGKSSDVKNNKIIKNKAIFCALFSLIVFTIFLGCVSAQEIDLNNLVVNGVEITLPLDQDDEFIPFSETLFLLRLIS